jgi:hypothetical protein
MTYGGRESGWITLWITCATKSQEILQELSSARGDVFLGVSEGKHSLFLSMNTCDDEARKEWVKEFTTQSRGDGVDTRLDHWHAGSGVRSIS